MAPLIRSRSVYAPSQPVPLAMRQFQGRDVFALWFSLGLGLLTAQTGALLVPGLPLLHALEVIIMGSLTGAGLLALAGTIGARTGLAAMATLRDTLGEYGALIPTLVNVIQLVGWGAFEVVVMGHSFDALAQPYLGVSCPSAWTLAAGLCATLVAALGPLSFVRRFLRTWGIWLLLLAALWLSDNLFAQHASSAWTVYAATGSISFSNGIDLVIAIALSWLPLISDYTRFGKHPGSMFWGTFFGFGIANLWFFTLGATYAASAGTSALLIPALASAGGGFALLLILMGEIDNAFADIHSAAVSCALLARWGNVRGLSCLLGALCIGLGLATPIHRFEGFLILIGSIFAPLFGVVLCDHFLIKRCRALPEGCRPRLWRYGALAAWLIGIVLYQWLYHDRPAIGASLPALLVSAGCHWVFARGWRATLVNDCDAPLGSASNHHPTQTPPPPARVSLSYRNTADIDQPRPPAA